MDSNFTQAEAEALLALEKRRVDASQWDYPDFGGRVTVPLASFDGRESFLLDVRRARINLAKGNYQNRRQVVVLARLDFGGGPHRNPDGEEIGSTHLHLYREDFGDKWASQVPVEHFSHLDDPWLTLGDFMRFCNIVEPPVFQRGLFT